MMQPNEEWIKFAEFYMVNRLGQIKTIERRSGRNKRLLPSIILRPGNCNGYRFVNISINGKSGNHYVHRIVAKAFLPNPNNLPQVNHKNGKKGDNRVENLEWCTQSQNIRHSFDFLNRKRPNYHGESHPCAILTFAQVQDIIESYWSKKSTAKQLAQKYKVAQNYIYVVAAKRSWKKEHAELKNNIVD